MYGISYEFMNRKRMKFESEPHEFTNRKEGERVTYLDYYLEFGFWSLESTSQCRPESR
jgi:hypothetical protein